MLKTFFVVFKSCEHCDSVAKGHGVVKLSLFQCLVTKLDDHTSYVLDCLGCKGHSVNFGWFT